METITQQYLRTRLEYYPDTGEFKWLPKAELCATDAYWNRAHAGKVAGSLHSGSGYLRIKLDGQTYVAHRLAWLSQYGELPKNEIDHIDRNRSNNRVSNLRLATRKENARNKRVPSNNTSGVIGVVWNSQRSKWQAQIEVEGKNVHLGIHQTIEEAQTARFAAEERYFGDWHGERP